jgi:hypothetical protein
LKSFIVLFWIYQSALVKLVYFSNLIFIFLAFKFYKEKQCNMCIACRFLPSTSLLSCACYRIIFSPLMIKVSLDLPKTCYMVYLSHLHLHLRHQNMASSATPPLNLHHLPHIFVFLLCSSTIQYYVFSSVSNFLRFEFVQDLRIFLLITVFKLQNRSILLVFSFFVNEKFGKWAE